MFKPALTFKSLISLTTASVFLFSSIAPAAQQVTQYATGKYAQKYSNYGVDMSPQSLNSYNYQTSVQTHNLTETEKTRLIKDKELMDKMGYDVRVDSNARTVTVLEKGTQNPVMEFPFSDPDRLRQYSPKSINQMLKNEMMKVKSAGKAALSHSTKNLPAESAVFFMAMGGVVATQLVSNYSQNPVAMKQHIEHSLSPMGVFGFYAFMSAQGITSNLLGMYLKNPAFHHMIPYLGMSVGMFAQNYLSQIMMNPNVMACAKVMMGNKVSDKDLLAGADKDPCNTAYEQLALGKVLWESAPMLVSMLTSSALAGGIQSLAAQGIAEASEKQAVKNLGSNIAKARLGAFMRASESTAAKAVLRVTGVDVATWILPGGMQVKGIRLLLVKGLQIAAFVQIDQWLNRSITYMWKNAFDGDELDNIATHVEENVNSLKRSQWKSDDTELQANMKLFKEKMAAWRMTNLAEVYESYSNWQDSITQLMSMYNASYSFYKDFIQQVRTERYGKNYAQPLERLSPLYGIKANLEENQKDFLLTDPAFIERQQFQTLQAVAQEAKELLKEENLRDLTTAQKQALKTIVSGMSSEEDQVLGKALLLLNSEIRTAAQNYSMQAYYKILWSIYTALGAPSPMMEKGRGWVTYYTQAPTSAEKIKGVSFYRKVGDFYTPNITDFFIMQMICGPDVERGDQAIKSSLGYPSVFMPPAIRNDKDQFDSCSSSRLSANGVASIYSIPVQSAGGNYSGFVSYLAAQARPSVVGDQATNSFDNWWQKNTESQMQAAFAQFSRSYEDILIKMVKKIYRQGFSSFNRGSVYNGTMNAAFQEERVYLSLLNELLTPNKDAYVMNMPGILAKAPTQPLLVEVETQFAILNSMVKKIQIVQIDGKERIQSPLENSQFEEQLTKIQAALKKVQQAMGIKDASSKVFTENTPSEPAPPVLVQVNKAQRNMAVQALESLEAVASEMMMYGTMANAMSWDKIRNLKQVSAAQKAFQDEIEKKKHQLGGGMTAPGR